MEFLTLETIFSYHSNILYSSIRINELAKAIRDGCFAQTLTQRASRRDRSIKIQYPFRFDWHLFGDWLSALFGSVVFGVTVRMRCKDT